MRRTRARVVPRTCARRRTTRGRWASSWWSLLCGGRWFGAALDQRGETIELALDAGAPSRQPRLGGAETRGVDLHRAHPADLLRGHETRRLEHLHVLDDRGQRDRERLGQLTDRCRAVAEPLDDGPTGRIGERLEGLVEHARPAWRSRRR